MKRYDLESMDYDHVMFKRDDGDWVRYEDAAARIAELEAEIVERRKDYSACIRDQDARIAELEAQLAAAQERNTNLQSEHLDHVSALHKRIKELEKKNDHK